MPLSVGLMSLTTPASAAWESISPLVKFYLHLPKVCTHRDECKSCKKIGCSFRNCCWWKLILAPDVLSPTPSICFFVYSFLCSFSFPLSSPLLCSWSKESADTSAAAQPPLSALFYFSWWGCGVGGGGWYREQESQSEKERTRRNYSVLPPSVSFLLHPPLAPSTLITLTFVFLSILPFSSCFSSYLRLSFLVDNADVRSCTHAGARTREDGITGAVDGKITNWISKRQ